MKLKPHQKRGHGRHLVAVEISPKERNDRCLVSFQSVEIRLKTQGQNDCHQAAYTYIHAALRSYLALKLSYLYLSIPLE